MAPQLVAAAVTVVPAIAALWLLLRRYEGYFDERRVFFSLVVGFFAALVIAALENFGLRFNQADGFVEDAGLWAALIWYVLGYALLESGAKLVVLGSKGFRVRKDTPYYGAALGLGFGAMWSLQFVSLYLQGASGDELWARLAVGGVMATGAVLAQGASGVWLGHGASQGRLWSGLLWGWLALMPLLVPLFFWSLGVGWAAFVGLGYGIAIFAWTDRKVLETIVPPEIRDMVRKDHRRRQRRRGRDEPQEPEAPQDSPAEPAKPPVNPE